MDKTGMEFTYWIYNNLHQCLDEYILDENTNGCIKSKQATSIGIDENDPLILPHLKSQDTTIKNKKNKISISLSADQFVYNEDSTIYN